MSLFRRKRSASKPPAVAPTSPTLPEVYAHTWPEDFELVNPPPVATRARSMSQADTAAAPVFHRPFRTPDGGPIADRYANRGAAFERATPPSSFSPPSAFAAGGARATPLTPRRRARQAKATPTLNLMVCVLVPDAPA
jgi:hypothetical protein